MSSERGNWKLKLIDRWIGIPLVFILGSGIRLFRKISQRSHLAEGPLRRVGVLMTAAIGDTILVSAILEDIRAAWPKCEIVIFLGASNRPMSTLLEGMTIIPVSATHPFETARAIRRAGDFDAWIDTGQWTRLNALLSLIAQTSWRIGFRTPGQARHFGFDQWIEHRSDLHEMENFRNLVRGLGLQAQHLPEFKRGSARGESIVFHMFAGGQNPWQKEWPKESWLKLAEQLPQDAVFVLTGGKENQAQAEAFLAFATKENSNVGRRIQNQVGQMTLSQTADLLSSARLVISVNTGILHLAAATGAPTIGLHGPTSSKRWGPVGSRVISVSSPRGCSPCLNLGFEFGCPLDACMREIQVDTVLNAVAELRLEGF